METKAFVFRKWDDLVFANRNQSYGAYVLRKAYSNRVLLGWGASKGLVILLIALFALKKPTEKIKADLVLPPLGDLRLTDYVPPIKPNPPAKSTRPQKSVNQNTTIQVVTTPIETAAPVNTEPISGDPNGVDNGTPIESTGTGTDIIETPEPPAALPKEVIFAEVMPAYDGGMEAIMKFVKKHLRYPASARRQGIDGTVYVSFVVNGDGSVSKVTLLRGIHVDCDEEAMRVISLLPGWKGGKQHGTPVNVRMVLPIVFKLN